MNHTSKTPITVWLFAIVMLFAQSCADQSSSLEEGKVQFSLTTLTPAGGKVQDDELSDDARLRITVENSAGEVLFADHEMLVLKSGDGYVTDPLELPPGSYTITDFMIAADTTILNATPRSESQYAKLVNHAVPHKFSVSADGLANVSMQVIDARKERAESFGYYSFKKHRDHRLSFIVNRTGARHNLQGATAELRQGKNLIATIPVKQGMNIMRFEGDPDATYTLSVLAGDAAHARTFNLRQLKKQQGERPLRITLEPALLLKVHSSIDDVNEYGDLFEFALDGTGGEVKINWGNGHENNLTLPFIHEHEYTFGTYTAIITCDLHRITNLYGFDYGTIIYGIDGLTNLTGLKTYNPSWGAVPIKVDLSKCNQLETIYIEKHGAPYEPIDLRTDFKLPEEHFIKDFIFYVPSLDPTREFITPDEFEVMINNIYNNTVRRGIHDGKFFVYPIDAYSPEAAAKMETLRDQYGWDIRLDGNIWDDYSGEGRTRLDLDARREHWLRDKFPGKKRVSRSVPLASVN